MPAATGFADLPHSELAGGPARIFYRQWGSGTPVIFLHGGWGYEIYPLDHQQRSIAGFRVIAPDRSGYGRSTKPASFSADFHRRAVQETLAFLDALGLHRCIFWGHSDGSVIAALLGLAAPQRCLGLIFEAFHYDRRKGARDFFRRMAVAPDSFGEHVCAILAADHGEDYWRDLIRSEGRAWLEIAALAAPGHADSPRNDLYDGRLSQLQVPAVFIHGAQDPRTEPGELEAVRRELPRADMRLLPAGGHSPHIERESAAEFTRLLRETLAGWNNAQP